MSVPPNHGNEYLPTVSWMAAQLAAQAALADLELHRRPVDEDPPYKHLTYQQMASTDSNTDVGAVRLIAYIRLQITARVESASLEDIREEADAIDEALHDQGGLDPSGDYAIHAYRVRTVQPEGDPTAGGRRWSELGGVYEFQAFRIQ
jgi:hypothetical protein